MSEMVPTNFFKNFICYEINVFKVLKRPKTSKMTRPQNDIHKFVIYLPILNYLVGYLPK